MSRRSHDFLNGGHMPIIDTMTFLHYIASIMEGVAMLVCRVCKQVFDFSFFSKDSRRPNGFRSACKACSAKEFQRYRSSPAYVERLAQQKRARTQEKKENPVARWAAMAIGNARKRAKENGLEFSISKEWLVAHAPKTCPLLEIALDYGATASVPASASIDRVDSAGGYTPTNCKIISFKANRIKTNATVAELQLLAKNIETY